MKKLYLRSPDTCMDENMRAVPPECFTEFTKLTYFCLVATSELLGAKITMRNH